MNEENQVYFVDSDTLPPAALERKHRLEQDPSFRTNHMEYMKGMEIIQSDIKDKVLKAMDEFDYDAYTAAEQLLTWNRWLGRQKKTRKIILEILSIFLHLFILPTTVRITAYTADSTVTTTSAERS